MDSYDLIVIGTGTAAQVAAARVRRAGRSVAVIDHRPFGGTCALRGCDPKKMLVSGAEAADWARRMHRRGVVGELCINWKELIAFRRTFTDPVPKKREESFAKQGIDVNGGVKAGHWGGAKTGQFAAWASSKTLFDGASGSLRSIGAAGLPRTGRTSIASAGILAPRLNPPHAQKAL
jgi:Pyridine nucleotide-disulphide oxidoreductase